MKKPLIERVPKFLQPYIAFLFNPKSTAEEIADLSTADERLARICHEVFEGVNVARMNDDEINGLIFSWMLRKVGMESDDFPDIVRQLTDGENTETWTEQDWHELAVKDEIADQLSEFVYGKVDAE